MRSLLVAVAALIPASLTLLPGCPLGCGGWEGRGDTMLRSDRGDAVMLCANGGFSLTKANGEPVEGVFEWTDSVHASSPDTGARVFSMTSDPGSTTMASPELPGTWTQATLDKVELDHAHVLCTDLESRAWWSTATVQQWLPEAVAFKKPAAGFANAEACYAAQASGDYPEEALCEDELLVCPDGRVTMNQGQSTGGGSYGTMYGELSVNSTPGSIFSWFVGVFSANGTLTTHDGYDSSGTNLAVWHQVPVSEMSNGAACH